MQAHQTKRVILFILPVLFLLSSCSEFRKIQKSDDVMKKYNAAVKYYDQEKYSKAAILLEEILPLLRGKEEAEKAQFLYAYSHFHQQLYIESAYYFKLFYETYGRSQQAEEALFMNGYSLYLQSPNHNLDQTSTFEAINALQNFINVFAYSEYVEKATKILDELQERLATKAYENAKLYFEVGRYKAALVALETFSSDFPDSDYNEEISYLKVKVGYELAKNSLPKLQRERYFDTLDYYQEFVDKFPNSKFGRDAERFYTLAQQEIENLNKSNNTSDNS